VEEHPVLLKNRSKKRRGAALVEYALLIAGVALICAAAVSIFGHKTNDMISAVATVLPGAHTDDNNPIVSGHMIETAPDANGNNALDVAAIKANSNTDRLGVNVGGAASPEAGNGFGGLIVESGP
jgi:Flp pilus assembly pilin Flp